MRLPGGAVRPALASSQAILFRKALELLPERMKSLLVKRFVEEVPSRTIAREEGISTDAIDMRVYRGKRADRDFQARLGSVLDRPEDR